MTLSRSVRSRMMSASLPGVSVPILLLEAVGARAFDGGEFEHLARLEELPAVLLAGEPARPDLVLLQREHRAHLGEEVVRHRGLDVDAETRPDADVDRLLGRRIAVAHQRLDIAGDRDRAAGVLDQLPLGVVERAAVDVGRVGLERRRWRCIFSRNAPRPNSPTPTWMLMRAPTSRAAFHCGIDLVGRAARRGEIQRQSAGRRWRSTACAGARCRRDICSFGASFQLPDTVCGVP